MLFMPERPQLLALGPGASHLAGFALPVAGDLIEAIHAVAASAPFRQMATPGGKLMSVAMTNCGGTGWVTDRRGYRYQAIDPATGLLWPAMPASFADLAARAAAKAGFPEFKPDAALINRYRSGARMSLHQDRDEQDFSQPIVSVSLGLPAVFLWGGRTRAERPSRHEILHGDVIVWGGVCRLNYHGVQPVAADEHPLTGNFRYNLTFRRAL